MNRTTLNKATSPDATPTPGYLFDEIAKVTHDPIGNDRLVEYLLKRLESPSADVKAKVLNIVKHVCRKGNHQFRRAWQREAGAIKAHLQFHTAPDPLRGDEPSKRVREAAKEALEAVFDASRDEKKTDPALAGRIQGFGVSPAPEIQSARAANDYPSSSSMPTAYAQPSYASAGSASSAAAPRYSGSSRYEGIGNPAFQDPRNQPKTLMERVADVVREKVEKQAENIPGVGGVKPPWMTQSTADLPAGYNFASNRGGSSQYSSTAGSYDPTLSQRTTVDSVWSDPRSPRPAFGVSGAPLATAQAVTNGGSNRLTRTSERSDGKYEQSLVNELCAPGGVRPVPPKDKLDGFCRACRTLDAEWVVTWLNEKMSPDEDWKVQHKALCVLEAILQAPGLESYADQLDQAPDNLEALYNSKNPSVRERAQKVWRILYEDEESKNGSTYDHAGASQEGDLLGTTGTMSPPPSSSSQRTSADINLLDFGSDMTPSSGTTPNLFGSLGGASLPAATSQLNPPSAAQGSAGLPNMFQNLSVKGSTTTPKPTSQPAAPMPGAPGSGFSFLSTGAPNSATSTTAPATPSINLFDIPMTTSSGPTMSSARPSQTGASVPMDLFSMPISTAPATFSQVPLSIPMSSTSTLPFMQSSPPATGKPMMTGQSFPAAAAQGPKKPVDSFNFVQEALQSAKKA